MLEFMKVDAPTLWPAMCICGAQKGPLVDTMIEKPGYGGRIDPGRIYLCRLCVTRSARVLGLVKGDEMTRLQDAADELAQQQREATERQEIIDRMTRTAGEREQKLQALEAYIEQLQGELALRKAQANQILAQAKELAVA